MTKGQFRLRPKTYAQYKELIPFQIWYNENKKNPIFRHLVAVAYRNWKPLVCINNKVVKKKAASIGASLRLSDRSLARMVQLSDRSLAIKSGMVQLSDRSLARLRSYTTQNTQF